MSLDDEMIDTPDGPVTWAQWKKKHPVQIPSRRTNGKDLPVKVKRFTEKPWDCQSRTASASARASTQ